jgi:hypothetical protein
MAQRVVRNMGKKTIPQHLQDWIEARKRHHLSHAQVQMARELGMNAKKLGKLDNHDQEPWKVPLPQFIEHLYFKRFGREQPEVVQSIEERARAKRAKKEARKEARRRVRDENDGPPGARHERVPILRVPGHRSAAEREGDGRAAVVLHSGTHQSNKLR